MLVSSTQLLQEARENRVAVGAFNVIQLEHAEAFVAAAESVNLPVILQISENAVKYHGALRPILAATCEIARASSAPIIVHLDHAKTRSLISEALQYGATSIMYDGSELPYEENLKQTAEVVAEAKAVGAHVEAELGEVGGKDGVHAPGVRTDPQDAAQFVADTGVDSLAVAVGSSHAMTTRTAELDLDLISRIKDAVAVPLVLHGSSGVADEMIQQAVLAGMSKINISTHLNKVQTKAITDFIAANPQVVDPRKYLGAGRKAVEGEVARLLTLLAKPNQR